MYEDLEDGSYYFWRGLIKIELKDTEGANEDLGKAGELGVKEAFDYMVHMTNQDFRAEEEDAEFNDSFE